MKHKLAGTANSLSACLQGVSLLRATGQATGTVDGVVFAVDATGGMLS
jgi:hypothetical protein